MKKVASKQIVGLCFLLAALMILPLTSIASENVKFGSIDIQKVLNESESGKKAKSELESLIKSKQVTIDEKGKTIEKLKADIEKQTSVLSADARKTKEEELDKLIRDYQRLVQDSQTEIKKKEMELTDTILNDIRELVEKIGEEEGYALIVERGMVLYSSKGTDITDSVLKKYDDLKEKSKK